MANSLPAQMSIRECLIWLYHYEGYMHTHFRIPSRPARLHPASTAHVASITTMAFLQDKGNGQRRESNHTKVMSHFDNQEREGLQIVCQATSTILKVRSGRVLCLHHAHSVHTI